VDDGTLSISIKPKPCKHTVDTSCVFTLHVLVVSVVLLLLSTSILFLDFRL
jgi:hypothetical protein